MLYFWLSTWVGAQAIRVDHNEVDMMQNDLNLQIQDF